ncbi:hypothetical protein I4F81_002315 [Pyropia yezoensis]|uniref:Uncharacterized protein n=1 Tax=Pyropia yezoensis TaxID=2788 RepID=A0ACC3BPQ2_PYRYE|nr:hypothetical protein I4F81_002315 [Neopyropia yezoensis]
MAQQARPASVAALPLAGAPATPGRPPSSAPLAVPAAGGVPPGGGPAAAAAAATAASAAATAAATAALRASAANVAAGAAAASRAAAAAAATPRSSAGPPPPPVPVRPLPQQQQTVIGVDVRVPAGVLDDGAALFTRVPLQLHELTGVRPAPAPPPTLVQPRLPAGGGGGTPSTMSVVSMAPSSNFQNSATSLAACGLPARLTEEALESVIDRAKGMSIGTGLPPEEGARHVTVWHKVEGRKIAGNAAPLRRNLYRYLERHPECEVYLEQDKLLDANGGVDPVTGESLTTFHEEHVPIWHTLEARKVTGNAAPLKKNLAAYLAKHKHCEVDPFGEPTHHVRLGSGGPCADVDGVVSGGPAGVATGDEVVGVAGGGGVRSGAGDSGMRPNLLIAPSAQSEEMALANAKNSAPGGFGRVGGGGLLGGSGGIMSGSGGDGGHLRDDLMLSGAGVGSFGGGAMSVTLGNTPGEMAMLLGGGHTPVGCSIDLDHAVGGGEAGMDFSPSNFLSLYASPSERMLTLMQHPK